MSSRSSFRIRKGRPLTVLANVSCGIVLTLTFQFVFMGPTHPHSCSNSKFKILETTTTTKKLDQVAEKPNNDSQLATYEKFITSRKLLAERIWNDSIIQRTTFEQNHTTIPGNNGIPERYGQRVLWDHWYAAYNCPFMLTRIGNLGDSGKWICGLEEIKSQKNCIVFSFSTTGTGDFSFEKSILKKTVNCIVYIFNPALRKFQTPKFFEEYPDRVFLHQIGLRGARDRDYANVEDRSFTLKRIMKKMNVDFIDIVTMDIEGLEIPVLLKTLRDFPDYLPFGQLDIEIHAQAFRSQKIKANQWRDKLEQIGVLRPFHFGPKLSYQADPKLFVQYSFLNIKSPLFRMNKDKK